MAYTKTVWVDNQEPSINATNLNHIETGIKDAHDAVATKLTAPSSGSNGQVLQKTASGTAWITLISVTDDNQGNVTMTIRG